VPNFVIWMLAFNFAFYYYFYGSLLYFSQTLEDTDFLFWMNDLPFIFFKMLIMCINVWKFEISIWVFAV
jgi:hypothetical protein